MLEFVTLDQEQGTVTNRNIESRHFVVFYASQSLNSGQKFRS